MESDLVARMFQFAKNVHEGQFRKYNQKGQPPEPYFAHCERVAKAAEMYGCNEFEVAAALAHDSLEDCKNASYNVLLNEFGPEVADLVLALTNPSKERPDLNRAQRKQLDRNHLAACNDRVKLLKLLDRLDNIMDMKQCDDAEFGVLYCNETLELVAALEVNHLKPHDELAASIVNIATYMKEEFKKKL